MITKSVHTEMANAKQKMLGYSTLLSYRYAQICIKHEIMSLMPVEIQCEGSEMKIEDVAYVQFPEEDTDIDKVLMKPKDPEYTVALIQGVMECHPDWKLDVLTEEGEVITDEDGEEIRSDDDHTFLFTMPEVDKDRRDAYTTVAKVLYDEAKARIDFQDAEMRREIVPLVVEYSDEDRKETDNLCDKIHEESLQTIGKMYSDKMAEIEEGYQRYLSGHPGESDGKPASNPAPDDSNDTFGIDVTNDFDVVNSMKL